jgi:hypothetical protein
MLMNSHPSNRYPQKGWGHLESKGWGQRGDTVEDGLLKSYSAEIIEDLEAVLDQFRGVVESFSKE